MTGLTEKLHTRDLFGVPIHALTMSGALDVIHESITSRKRLAIGVVNAAKLVNMRQDPNLREDVLSSDLILADGLSVVWAARLLRRPLPERVAGIDLMHAMLARGQEHGYRFYCLGATQDVLDKVLDAIATTYPGAKIAGWHHGYFSADEEATVVRHIVEAQPDILFVAMTSPRKERFMGRWAGQLNVPVLHGVGGSFDVLAGKVRRAPLGWQRLGLEWLYRLLQEPRRLWKRYLITNTLFCSMLAGELARGLRASRPPRA